MASNKQFQTQFEARIIEVGPIPPAGGPARETYLETRGKAELATANKEYAAVVRLLADWADVIPPLFAPIESSDDRARHQIQQSSRGAWRKLSKQIPKETLQLVEPLIRTSEKAAVNALNYLEDTESAQEAHEAIHRAAFIRSGLFGCPITYEDGQFWWDCTVSMSHLRMGMSAGITSDFYCSICDKKMEDCDHVMGSTYSVVAQKDDDGRCSVCGLLNCGHKQGETYPVTASGIGREIAAHEVSMVSRPRYPLARINKMTREVPERYQPYAEAGVLDCDECLGPCGGLVETAGWDPNLD